MTVTTLVREIALGNAYQTETINGRWKPIAKVSPYDFRETYFVLDADTGEEFEAESRSDAFSQADTFNRNWPKQAQPEPRRYWVQLAASDGDHFPYVEVLIDYDDDGNEVFWEPTFWVMGPLNVCYSVTSRQAAIALSEQLNGAKTFRLVKPELAQEHAMEDKPAGFSAGREVRRGMKGG